MYNYTAQSFWSKNKKGFIQEELISSNIDSDEILIKSLYSGISYGTEKIVFTSQVPRSQYALMKAPHQLGRFNDKVKYGYMNVGKVLHGSKDLLGQRVYSMYPHQSFFVIKANQATLIPKNIPSRRALLTANMETAINAVWDSKPTIGDNVYVIGAGIVGLLMSYVLSKIIGVKVIIIDKDASKKKVCSGLGLSFETKLCGISNADIIYECSGDPRMLNSLTQLTDLETRICILSWYGKQVSKINMGENWFSKRIKLIFSQVSNISAYRAKKWDNNSRRKLALDLLSDKKLDNLIDTKDISINQIERYFKSDKNNGLCKIVKY